MIRLRTHIKYPPPKDPDHLEPWSDLIDYVALDRIIRTRPELSDRDIAILAGCSRSHAQRRRAALKGPRT